MRRWGREWLKSWGPWHGADGDLGGRIAQERVQGGADEVRGSCRPGVQGEQPGEGGPERGPMAQREARPAERGGEGVGRATGPGPSAAPSPGCSPPRTLHPAGCGLQSQASRPAGPPGQHDGGVPQEGCPQPCLAHRYGSVGGSRKGGVGSPSPLPGRAVPLCPPTGTPTLGEHPLGVLSGPHPTLRAPGREQPLRPHPGPLQGEEGA